MEEEEEPVTPAGRLFLREDSYQVINCAVGLKNRINIDSIKDEINNSIILQHPRFQSILVKDNQGKEHWKKTQVNLDKHIIIIKPNSSADFSLNNYLAHLSVSSPLSIDKPLWEFHLLMDYNYVVLRVHHALGDGISLMSLILAVCRKVDYPNQLPIIPSSTSSSSTNNIIENKWLKLVMVIWYSLIFGIELLVRILWLKDSKTEISGGEGVENWPRKIATAKFSLDHMKLVKKAIPHGTINDVLFGVISCGLSRYLDHRSSSKQQEGLRITGLAMVNTRKQPGLQDLSKLMKNKSMSSWWGNKFGFMLFPIYHRKNVDNPLEYVKRAKAMLDKKKLSLEAHISYRIGAIVMSILGPRFAALLNYRIICNSTFTISNVVGPQEEIMFAGNPITSLRVTSTSLAHALTMHMVSYAGKAEMQILVARDVIPDPEFLAKCFEDALLEMKDVATN